ncbi:hypothetical protein DAI43_19055 [Achromobacter xylosoxidans]|nr:hypothetical protein DAI43_19055 [Achromobacter xylosoxidans]
MISRELVRIVTLGVLEDLAPDQVRPDPESSRKATEDVVQLLDPAIVFLFAVALECTAVDTPH